MIPFSAENDKYLPFPSASFSYGCDHSRSLTSKWDKITALFSANFAQGNTNFSFFLETAGDRGTEIIALSIISLTTGNSIFLRGSV